MWEDSGFVCSVAADLNYGRGAADGVTGLGPLAGFGEKKGSFCSQNRFECDESLSKPGSGLARGEYFLEERRTSILTCRPAERVSNVMNSVCRERANSFWDQRKLTSK